MIQLRSLLSILFVLSLNHCSNIEDFLDKSLLSGLVQQQTIYDQGYIHFDNLGNITAEVNNLIFKNNPAFSEASFIGVFVFPRGADINLNCCTGTASVCGDATRSCLRGIGFSQDLGYLGSRFIFKEPPKTFNRQADKFYIPVMAAGKNAVPADYQGEYTPFSAPTNPVGDREQFDLYVGIYYNLFDGGTFRLRPINAEAEIGSQLYYSRISPDILSPKIEIESRFFAQSREDSPGSNYIIPGIGQWTVPPPLDIELDKRGRVVINEIGNSIEGTAENDFIELYNPTDFPIPLDDVFIQRYTSTSCQSLTSATQKEDLTGLIIQSKGFISLARTGHTLTNITKSFKSSGGITISNSDCIALTKGTYSIDSPIDKRVIDFVGLQDASGLNQKRGNGYAPAIYDDSSVSRCPDGGDSKDNSIDFLVEPPTPGLANTCDFSEPADSILNATAGELLITEVLNVVKDDVGFEGTFDPTNCLDTGADDFVEIVNASSRSINVGGGRLQYITSGGVVSSFYTLPSKVLAPGEYLVVVSQDKGCYNKTSLANRNAIFKSSASIASPTNFSSLGASIALTRTSDSLPTPQAGSAITSGTNYTIDYVGWAGSGLVFQTAQAPNTNPNYAGRRSLRRKNNTQNTFNNFNDFEVSTTINGTPGRAD